MMDCSDKEKTSRRTIWYTIRQARIMATWNAVRCPPGNVHRAHAWQALLDPVVERYRWSGLWRRYLRVERRCRIAFEVQENRQETVQTGAAKRNNRQKRCPRTLILKIGGQHANVNTSNIPIWGMAVKDFP